MYCRLIVAQTRLITHSKLIPSVVIRRALACASELGGCPSRPSVASGKQVVATGCELSGGKPLVHLPVFLSFLIKCIDLLLE